MAVRSGSGKSTLSGNVARIVAIAPCLTDFVVLPMNGQFLMLVLSNLTPALNSFSLSGKIARTTLSAILLELPLIGLMVF